MFAAYQMPVTTTPMSRMASTTSRELKLDRISGCLQGGGNFYNINDLY